MRKQKQIIMSLKEDNKAAVKIAEEVGGLEKCPVPLENLTIQKPSGEIDYLSKQSRVATENRIKKVYNIDRMWSNQFIDSIFQSDKVFQCDYLVPTGYNHKENGIVPSWVETWISSSSAKFSFVPSLTEDTGVGGYGTGGWYWRQFRLYRPNFSYDDIVWLSAWNGSHLVYG
ncbi:MAG: lytic exoenzyme target recognition domain-containing protein [Lactococcus raffinolactis]